MTKKIDDQEEEIIPTGDEPTDEDLETEDGEEVEEESDEEETPEDEEDETPEDEDEGILDGDESEETEDEDEGEDEPEVPKTPEVDYRKKFGESTRQNQILSSRFRELEQTLGDITKQEIPTDEEMKKIVGDWEYLSEREKNDQVKMVVLERRQNLILKSISDISKSATLAEEVNNFIEANPDLEGFETEFNEFILKPSNKGATLELLKDAFLHKKQPAKPTKVTKKKTPPSLNRGTSSGGIAPVKPRVPGEKSPEELKSLRTTNHKAYMEGIRKGTIK